MEIIKRTVTTEVVDKVVSCDGKYTRKVDELCPLEHAKMCISEYENKLSTVLWQRMIDRGLLIKIDSHPDIKKDDLTPEQKHDRFLYNAIDWINDSGCSSFSYYIFKPDTEQDIVDLLTYVSSNNETEGMYFPKEEYADESFICTRKNIIPGHKYLYCEYSHGHNYLYRLDEFRAKLNHIIDCLEEFL